MTLALAMIIDALMGEPRWLWDRAPHPAVVMGRAVGWADKHLNTGDMRRIKGLIAMLGLVLMAAVLGCLLQWLGWIIEMLVVAIMLAQRSLVDHVRAVADALSLSLGDARMAVAQIVGRDTREMDGPAISRAAIESAAENFSDGVIAPVFWFVVAGLPGLLVYKITNTADSMIGYRNEKYTEFGWAAARLDDVLNLIPARLAAVIIAASHGLLRAMPDIAQEAPRHRSPNAGWPEAAMARTLNIALAGPRSYDGQYRDFPYVNETGNIDIGAPQIRAACSALWRAWGLALVVVIILAVVLG